MKKIRYNSWIANNLLFKGYSTITIAAWVCTRYKGKEEMPQKVRNHECTHARQWIEMFFSGWVIMFILQLIFDISAWWYILPLFSFYIWYVLEWFFKSLFKLKNAYKDISFEKEAKASENDNCYLENMGYFEWLKYYGKNF